MEKLHELMESNPELKAKIEALDKDPNTTTADFIALVKEYGVEITEADFRPTPAGGEVSDNELGSVAGGGSCYCALGGGGKADENHDTCACVLAGCGIGDGPGSPCICPVAGTGY